MQQYDAELIVIVANAVKQLAQFSSKKTAMRKTMIMHVSRRRSAVTSAVVTYVNAQIIKTHRRQRMLCLQSSQQALLTARRPRAFFGISNEVEMVAINRPLRCAQMVLLISKHYFVD